jgi:hypothetical protein
MVPLNPGQWLSLVTFYPMRRSMWRSVRSSSGGTARGCGRVRLGGNTDARARRAAGARSHSPGRGGPGCARALAHSKALAYLGAFAATHHEFFAPDNLGWIMARAAAPPA